MDLLVLLPSRGLCDACHEGMRVLPMILRGDALSVLKTLPDESVQMIVTSPPYWALRRYDIPDIDFTDGWRGQLGQEPTPELFIAHLVEIFREARRVLRDDGVCFLNMGDCYAADRSGTHMPAETMAGGVRGQDLGPGLEAYRGRGSDGVSRRDCTRYGLKHKDLVGIPWMLAFALRADGWYLRSEIIWAKGQSFCPSYAGSVMPESVTDRPTRSHEQVFLLTKSERYFYDHEAVKERGVYPPGTIAAKGSGTREGNRRGGRKKDVKGVRAPSTDRRQGGSFQDRVDAGYACYDGLRNLRTVWAIRVEPFNEAHFATFPPDLVDPCLRAGTSAHGCCASCGAPWKRIVEYEPMPDAIKAQFEAARARTGEDHGRDDGFTTRRPNYQRTRIGERWEPTCSCEHAEGGPAGVVPCTVLDPFAGSGTTGVVCELRRLRFIGIELGDSYRAIGERRIGSVAPLFTEPITVGDPRS